MTTARMTISITRPVCVTPGTGHRCRLLVVSSAASHGFVCRLLVVSSEGQRTLGGTSRSKVRWRRTRQRA
ncbi:hypothetical protein B9W64_10015 [Streptomyces sp. CS159]|nr:hypothetical protein B9W64_10015 [Streptomyces sp. CS159]